MLCHNHQSFAKLEDMASRFKKVILLLDNDSEGKKLVQRATRVLRGRARVDLFYQRALLPASRGKIRHVEELAPFSEIILSRKISIPSP